MFIWCALSFIARLRPKLLLCQLCQLGSDYSSQLQGTSDPQWSLSLRKRAMGGEDQSIECQLKPANNSLTCCDVISKEPCEETLKPFHLILWWSYVGAFFENRIYREHEKYIFKPNSNWFLCQNNTTLCPLLWQLDNFRDPPSNPQIVSNHFKSSEIRELSLSEAAKKVQVGLLKSPTWTFLAASLRLSSRTFFSVHKQPGLLVVPAVAHAFTARFTSLEEMPLTKEKNRFPCRASRRVGTPRTPSVHVVISTK